MAEMGRYSRGRDAQGMPALFVRLVTHQYFFAIIRRGAAIIITGTEDDNLHDHQLTVF